MKYRVDGIIKFHPGIKFKLDRTSKITSASKAEITLNPTNGDSLSLEIALEADSEAAAEEMAAIELERISSGLSYFKNIPIVGRRIEKTAPEGSKSITHIKQATSKASVIVPVELEPEAAKELRRHLGNKYPPCFEDVISMWREAISIESSALKYVRLYGLMEFLFANKTVELTKWIKNREPLVQMIPRCRGKNCDTVYTYLRHRIHHPKGKPFPHTEIDNTLPKLRNLVREAIKERCGVNYA